jgi:Right handed beta helix region
MGQTFIVPDVGNIATALSKVTGGGDQVLIRGGDYDESLTNPLANGVAGYSWADPIRIAAYEGEPVWLRPTYGNAVMHFWVNNQFVEIDGVNMDATRGITFGGFIVEMWAEGWPRFFRVKNLEIIGPTNGIPNETTNAGSGVLITGLNAGDGESNSGHYEFQNITIHGGGDLPGDYSYGFYCNVADTLIEHCHIYDMSYQGIQIYSGHASVPSRCIVRNNIIHGMTRGVGHRGITISRGTAIQCYNNIIYDIVMDDSQDAGAIDLYDAHDAIICNNTIYNVRGPYACAIYNESNSPGSKVANNVAMGIDGGKYYFNNSGGNLTHSNNFGGDARFVNAAAGDFHLLADSPCINAGLAIPIAADADGVSRPQGSAFCQGAYEYVGTAGASGGELEEGYTQEGEAGSKPPQG